MALFDALTGKVTDTDWPSLPDNTHPNYYTGMSRDKLIDEHKAMLKNLTSVQQRCTQLLEEVRSYKKIEATREARKPLMSLDYFQEECWRTSAPMESTPATKLTEHILMAAMGCAGEGGEVVDLVKKVRFHGQAFNADRIIEEIGDVLWYVADMASALGVPLSEVAKRNMKKLEERYPMGFELRRRAASEVTAMCVACEVNPRAPDDIYRQCIDCTEKGEPF